MNRRNFLQTMGLSFASVVISDSIFASSNLQSLSLINFPNEVKAIVNGKVVKLSSQDSQTWVFQGTTVKLTKNQSAIHIDILAPNVSLTEISVHWKMPQKADTLVLNDQWERTYGDVSWHKSVATEMLPWYFMEHNGKATTGFGVKTGANTFCAWAVNNQELSLVMDTRSGGDGVQLGDRKLRAAEIVTIKNKPNESVFQTTRRFMKMMCDSPRMPKQPVYGINDWYFSYGKTSEKLILDHTQLMAPMAEGLNNRPFSVIDAGWFQGTPSQPDDCCWGNGMDLVNAKFGDMSNLADKIKKMGMRPGLWTRPLCGKSTDAKSLSLPLIKGREANRPVSDPSIPENLERIKNYFKLYKSWGYEMVKFDFTTYDIFGKWGFEMMKEGTMTSPNWRMYDNTKTNAEIIATMYKAIREAAGDTYIIGCNTFSHLSAGVFELNRIGDDTSGNEWERTRKMGVNTLAFRGIQQGTFYATDGDCVGLTTKISWERNKQWMELVAKSGTPLFISAQPDATGTAQKASIKECFRLASQNLPVGEPLDWLQNAFPKKWKLNGENVTFNWD